MRKTMLYHELLFLLRRFSPISRVVLDVEKLLCSLATADRILCVFCFHVAFFHNAKDVFRCTGRNTFIRSFMCLRDVGVKCNLRN